MLNYESEIEESLLVNLGKTFNIDDFNILQVYLKLRFLILNPKYQSIFKKLTKQRNINKTIQTIPKDLKENYIKYLFKQLKISQYLYKDIPLSFTYKENGLFNIYDSLEFTLLNSKTTTTVGLKEKTYDYIFKIIDEIYKENDKVKTNPIKLKYNNLLLLDNLFQIKEHKTFEIDGFIQDFTILSEEEECQTILAKENEESSDISLISEDILQDYLATHLELIEDGLIYIDKEYRLPDGRIDILAKDKDNNLVIIEVKVKDDERLPWQCIYYPYALANKYPNRKIRMITVAPQYKDSLFVVLNTLNITMYAFDILIKQKEIKQLNLKLIKKGAK